MHKIPDPIWSRKNGLKIFIKALLSFEVINHSALFEANKPDSENIYIRFNKIELITSGSSTTNKNHDKHIIIIISLVLENNFKIILFLLNNDQKSSYCNAQKTRILL